MNIKTILCVHPKIFFIEHIKPMLIMLNSDQEFNNMFILVENDSNVLSEFESVFNHIGSQGLLVF